MGLLALLTKRHRVRDPGPFPTPPIEIPVSSIAPSADRCGSLAGLTALLSVGCLAATVAPRLHLSLPLADGWSCIVGICIKLFSYEFFFLSFFVLYKSRREEIGWEITAQVLQNAQTAQCIVRS